MQCILNGISAALGQVQWTQLGIDFLEVGDRRHQSGFQGLHRENIFDAGAHGVASHAFGVGDHDLVRAVAEDATQCVDLRRGAPATRWRVGFVGDENQFRRDLTACNAATRFSFGHQVLHHLADVLDIEASTVKRAIGGHRAQHFADGLDSALSRGIQTLNYQGGGAHAHNQAVAAAVERYGGFFHELRRWLLLRWPKSRRPSIRSDGPT